MAAGLLQEVKALRERGCHRDLVSMQALGYKELMSHLEGEIPLEEAVVQIKQRPGSLPNVSFPGFGDCQRSTGLMSPGKIQGKKFALL